MKIQHVFIILFTSLFLLQNWNCRNGNSGDTGTSNPDSLRIADSLRQVHIKDSLYNDSILKAQNIKVKSNKLEPVVQKKVDKIIEAKTEASPLKDKSPQEIYKQYEVFVTKYDKNNKSHKTELSRWTNDPLFLALKKDDNWVEKIEELEEVLSKKK